MSKLIKKLYSKYFQKSRSFLLPILGIKKNTTFPSINSYLCWEGMYVLTDYKLILTYYVDTDPKWNNYLLHILMNNPFFHEYHEIDKEYVALSFDMQSFKDDFEHVLFGRYSKLSKLTKGKIREYYGYHTPEWAYVESFLFPDKYMQLYSELLDVHIQHIKHTGELCDKPDIDKETLKLKPNEKHHDADSHKLESEQNIQTDPDQQRLPLQ